MSLKYFYKIDNDKLIKGSGYIIPEGFLEYSKTNPPEEFIKYSIEELKANVKNSFINLYKSKIQHELDNLIVYVTLNDTMVVGFDADEASQLRISKKVQTMVNDTDIVEWVATDNNLYTLTKAEILSGLTEADNIHSTLVITYRKLMNEVLAYECKDDKDLLEYKLSKISGMPLDTPVEDIQQLLYLDTIPDE